MSDLDDLSQGYTFADGTQRTPRDTVRHLLYENERITRERDVALQDHVLLRQALWDVYAILGFDTDGDATPAHLGNDALIGTVLDAAREHRADYDEACEAVDL